MTVDLVVPARRTPDLATRSASGKDRQGSVETRLRESAPSTRGAPSDERVVDAHRGHFDLQALDPKFFDDFLLEGLARFGAKPPYRSSVCRRKRGEIHARDGAEQPCGLPFLFHRAASHRDCARRSTALVFTRARFTSPNSEECRGSAEGRAPHTWRWLFLKERSRRALRCAPTQLRSRFSCCRRNSWRSLPDETE